jgi:Subtilase family
VTIYFDANGRRLLVPQVRSVPQITAADGVDTTFFGFDSDGNGLPNFFGTSAAAPDAAAVAALALQAAGGPGSLRPVNLYRLLQDTASPVPLPNDRSASAAKAGPISFSAQGDWVRWQNYFGLAVDRFARQPVVSVSMDLSKTGMVWSTNPNRFHLGDSTGVAIADITQSVSADQTVMTLAFVPGRFRGGDAFRFGMSAFAPAEGTTEIDPDRFRGMKVSVRLLNGDTFSGTVAAAPPKPNNRFAGAGLVNAAAAVHGAGHGSGHGHDD